MLRNGSQDQGSGSPSWIDNLIDNNPQAVMKVLAGYGYTGFLAPVDSEEMSEVTYDLIDQRGEEVVVELLKNHPLYEAIREVCTGEGKTVIPFKNASGTDPVAGNSVITSNIKSFAETALIIIGAFYVITKVMDIIAKRD